MPALVRDAGRLREPKHSVVIAGSRRSPPVEHDLQGCAVDGVKSFDWFIGYMRANLSDKIRASLAIGPF